ncbi:MAG: SCO family protein [Bacteroidetes bacterium]|nr:SCO family protein [Rhodothermia bacterium]MCS7155233.1 SCO family protein [Bacteroidota bacterium]MCX7907818.1 SCO family protein [Bacteroidota bacterium]MDW8138637.1 SCO family protein [Bacteroidota bacterium]MDW8284777.1 SCO family protein [Bacteroidota bacterium]
MKRNRTLWIAGGLLAAAGLILYYAIADRGRSTAELPVYGQVPDFRLINHDEQPISLADLKGRYWVAEFFFASCAGICLQMNQNMTLVQQAFRDQPDRVKIVSFTVDPERDTPEILKAYSRNWNARLEQWIFVTGPKPEIYRLARYGFRLAADEIPPQEEGGPYDFIHSSKFVLVDPQGQIRGYYDGTDRKAVETLIRDLRSLLRKDSA